MLRPPNYALYRRDTGYDEHCLLLGQEQGYDYTLLTILRDPQRIAYKRGFLIQQKEHVEGGVLYRVIHPDGDERSVYHFDATRRHTLIAYLAQFFPDGEAEVLGDWYPVLPRRYGESGTIDLILEASPPPTQPYCFAQREALKACILQTQALARGDYRLLSDLLHWFAEADLNPRWVNYLPQQPWRAERPVARGYFVLSSQELEGLRTRVRLPRLPEPREASYCRCQKPGRGLRYYCCKGYGSCGCPCHANSAEWYGELQQEAQASPLARFQCTLPIQKNIQEDLGKSKAERLRAWHVAWLNRGEDLARARQDWQNEGRLLLDQISLTLGHALPTSFLVEP